jgi:Ran GTPase-activating protein (RanGAP) involved in mRNA processing and transport
MSALSVGVLLTFSATLPLGAFMASPPPAATPPPAAPRFVVVNAALTDAQLQEHIASGALTAQVVEVKLSSNQLGPDGIKALLASPIERLQSLVLYDNRLGDAGAQHLGASKKLAGVGHLDISYNQLTTAGVMEVLGPDSMVKGPTYISVAGSALGDAGVAKLVASPKLAAVDTLNLRRVGLTDAGLAAIAAAALPKLTRIDVSKNAISPAGRAILAPLRARGVRVDD